MPSSTPTLTTLASFNGDNGESPETNLVIGADGNLYGSLQLSSSTGTLLGLSSVFELASLGGGAYASTASTDFVLFSAFSPQFGLTTDSAGNLYGTAAVTTGGDVVYESSAAGLSTWATPAITETPATAPWSDLFADGTGDVFLTARTGGPSGYGAIIEMTPTLPLSTYPATTTATVTTFDGADGKFVNPGLIGDASGDLFGTTAQGGGTGAFGTLFEIAHSAGSYASTPAVLATFNNSTGMIPEGALTRDAAGNLYGITSIGGANGHGTIFELGSGLIH